MNIDYLLNIIPAVAKGAGITLSLFAFTLLFSLPLGLPFALGSISRLWPVRMFCRLYIWVFRGTPLMLQLFFFYFFLPIAFGVGFDPFTTAVLTFVFNYAAYFAEIYRGGIESIEFGQHEAAKSLGLSKSRTMFAIILPQTVKRVMPAISNEAITLIKDTALASVISVAEIMKNSRGIVNRDVNATAYFTAALLYLLFTFILTGITKRVERHFSKHEGRSVA